MIIVADLEPFNAQFKLTLEEAVTADARRDTSFLIRGMLSNIVSPTDLASWTGGDDTPDWIRAAGGRIAYAIFYGARYSDEDTTYTNYAKMLYDEGLSMLKMVVDGNVTLPDLTPLSGGTNFTTDMFVATTPVFSMDDVF